MRRCRTEEKSRYEVMIQSCLAGTYPDGPSQHRPEAGTHALNDQWLLIDSLNHALAPHHAISVQRLFETAPQLMAQYSYVARARP